jgi:hypothetical protein
MSLPFPLGLIALTALVCQTALPGADQQPTDQQADVRERPAPAGLPATGTLTVTEIRFVHVPVKAEAQIREELRVEKGEALTWASLAKLSEALRSVDPSLTLGIQVSDFMELQLTVRGKPGR